MADPTLTNIQILRSPVPHKRPDPSLMLDGQLAINYKQVDPGLFTKTVEGTLIKVGPVSITNDEVPPNDLSIQDVDGFPGNSHGEEWLDGRDAFFSPVLKIWDEDKDDWITANGFQVNNATGDFTLEKSLFVDKLYANYVEIDGPLSVNGNFLPFGTSCEHDLGVPENRWKGLYSCLVNTLGDVTAGGNAAIGGFVTVGEYLTVNENADILGTVTIGTTPGSGNSFDVNSPSNFASTVDIVSDLTARNLELSKDLKVTGSTILGTGCGVDTLNIYSTTTFHCDVSFKTNPVTFEYLVVTDDFRSIGDTIIGDDCSEDTLTVDAESTFNCLTHHEGELRVGKDSKAMLRSFGEFEVLNKSYFRDNVDITGSIAISEKATSKPTEDSDSDITLVTKGWITDTLQNNANFIWTRSGQSLYTSVENLSIVPNSGTGTLGANGDPWSSIFGGSLSLTGKGTSAQTLDSDPDNTLITKKYFNDNAIRYDGDDVTIGEGCGTTTITLAGEVTAQCDVTPNANGTLDFGSSSLRWKGLYSGTLSLTGLGSSAHPDASSPDNTLITKKYYEDSFPPFVNAEEPNINIGLGCGSSTITLNGETILGCDVEPVTNKTIDIGTTTKQLSTIYSETLVLSGKGTSAQTIASDPDGTLITKKYYHDNLPTSFDPTAGSVTLGNGCDTSTVVLNGATVLNCDVTPNVTKTIDIGTSSEEIKDIYSENIILSGKGSSAPTVSGDPDNTLITKKYYHDNLPSPFDPAGSGSITLGSGCGTSTIILNGDVTLNCNMLPDATDTRSIGSNINRLKEVYANDVYTGDLHLKNERGDWTLIEEEDCLTMRNNKTGKRYAISMTPYEG